MSTLKTGALRGTSGTADSIQLHASNQSVTFPGAVTFGGTVTGDNSGKILQIKYATVASSNSNEQDITSSNYTLLTAPTLTITPTASGNKIIIMTDINYNMDNDDSQEENTMRFQMLRTQTGLSNVVVQSAQYTQAGKVTVGGWLGLGGRINFNTIDTTVNANPITYKYQARLAHEADSIRFHLGDTFSGSNSCSVIAMEVAAST